MGIITQVFLPLVLAFIMFSMGLALVKDDFRRVLVQPKAFTVGAFSQVILLPLIAFLIVSAWGIHPALAVGVMILSVCPGGVTSNLLTHLAKGDTALSISLTAVISIISVITVPFVVNFSLFHFMGATETATLPIGKTIFGIFMITTVPVLLGMWINHRWHNTAVRLEKRARTVSSVLFVVIVLGAILKEKDNIVRYFIEAGPVALTLNIVMMFVAAQLARFFSLPRKQGIAIALECGLQNSTLAIMVAATMLKNNTMMIPGAIYGLLMFATSGAYIYLLSQKRSRVAVPTQGYYVSSKNGKNGENGKQAKQAPAQEGYTLPEHSRDGSLGEPSQYDRNR